MPRIKQNTTGSAAKKRDKKIQYQNIRIQCKDVFYLEKTSNNVASELARNLMRCERENREIAFRLGK